MSDAIVSRNTCGTDATVVTNVNSCHEHYYLTLSVAHFPQSTPGQFLQIACADDSEESVSVVRDNPDGELPHISSARSGESAFLRRPFSIADRMYGDDGRTELLVVHRAIGPGTRWLERRRAGDIVNITGPLGMGFSMPTPRRTIVLIGGGVGIPPMLYFARTLSERGHAEVLAIFGARSRELLPVELSCEPASEVKPNACLRFPYGGNPASLVTTDDGTLGIHGRVTDALSTWHARFEQASRGALVVACGPEPMLRAVAKLTRKLSLECELCIERMMGCGLGTCLACATRVRDSAAEEGWRYALTCLDGPVFERDKLFDYS